MSTSTITYLNALVPLISFFRPTHPHRKSLKVISKLTQLRLQLNLSLAQLSPSLFPHILEIFGTQPTVLISQFQFKNRFEKNAPWPEILTQKQKNTILWFGKSNISTFLPISLARMHHFSNQYSHWNHEVKPVILSTLNLKNVTKKNLTKLRNRPQKPITEMPALHHFCQKITKIFFGYFLDISR